MSDKNIDDLSLRIGSLAEALVAGVLRALAARKDHGLPAGQLGGCVPVDGGVLRVTVTFGETAGS